MVAAIVIYNFWTVILRIAFTEMSEEVIRVMTNIMFSSSVCYVTFSLKELSHDIFSYFLPRKQLSLN